LFSSAAFRAADDGAAQTTAFFVPFITATFALTIVTVALWLFRKNIGRWRRRLVLDARQKVRARDVQLHVEKSV
jgi:hydrogenase/urease accessory protein HupE